MPRSTPPAMKPPEAPRPPAPAPRPAPTPAVRQSEMPSEAPPATTGDQGIAEAVARALYERARVLSDAGDHASAKMLLQEALSLSSDGPVSGDARALLAISEESLGDLPSGDAATLDPFASREAEDSSDPYDEDPAAVVIPEADAAATSRALEARDRAAGQRTLALYGGLYGFTAGMAVSGYEDGNAAIAGLLGGGAGVGAAYLLNRGRLSSVEASTIAWSGAWLALAGGIVVDLSGIGTSTPEGVTRGVAVGGLLGTGAGLLLANNIEPTAGDVALINSLGLYGTATSLMIAVGLAPVEVEGYSLNALLGAGVGLGAGMLAAQRLEVSSRRMRWVDLGAALGMATPWVLVYPVVADGTSQGDEQTVGVISALGVLGGAYLAWRLTEDMDASVTEDEPAPAISGLLQHTAGGAWALGVPLPRLPDSTLGPRTRGFGMTLDLVSGQF
jgi:hypothetical protein